MKKFQTFNIIKTTKNGGFSLVELLISVGIFGILIGIITLNLNTAQHKATIQTTVETLITDLNQQQIKAMVGDTEGRTTLSDYGIHFDTTNYTLFHGTYSNSETTNFSINLDDIFQVSTTFPNSAISFEKGSGEIVGFDPNQNTITVTDTANGEQKVIVVNRLGVITSVD